MTPLNGALLLSRITLGLLSNRFSAFVRTVGVSSRGARCESFLSRCCWCSGLRMALSLGGGTSLMVSFVWSVSSKSRKVISNSISSFSYLLYHASGRPQPRDEPHGPPLRPFAGGRLTSSPTPIAASLFPPSSTVVPSASVESICTCCCRLRRIGCWQRLWGRVDMRR